LHALFGAATDIHQWALLDHPVPRCWVRERIALLGDACHAMLPYLAQGPAMAMEDSAIEASGDASGDPAAAIERREESEKIAAAGTPGSQEERRVYHRSSPAGRVLRDLALTAMAAAVGIVSSRRLECSTVSARPIVAARPTSGSAWLPTSIP
jgi:salicylate hydroxylase